MVVLLAGASAPERDSSDQAPLADVAASAFLQERAEAGLTSSRSAPRPVVTPTVVPVAPQPRAVAPKASPTPFVATPAPTRQPTVAPAPKPPPEPEAEPAPEPVTPVAPVGGLSQQQMDHAATIVAMGQRAGLPEYAYVIAIATVLQETYLRNLANPKVPESLNFPHDGTGTDHDSVGLFQQRPSTGWGTVAQLMDPSYAATKFYQALVRVSGWEDLAVTVAAQAVQRSAFPDHYAKHEPLARQIVDALT
jgi:hypothetical protein